MAPKVRYVLYLDGYDTVLTGDATNIVRDFHYYDAELVVCSNWENFPLLVEE